MDSHGEFCVRGGVVDVFPAGNAQPVRLDFIGDTVESVRQYDPATQRSTGEIDRVVIIPLQEVFEHGGDGKAEEGIRDRGLRDQGRSPECSPIARRRPDPRSPTPDARSPG